MSAPDHDPRAAGFTLIEVLAAIFLTGIVMSVAVTFQIQLGQATDAARDRVSNQRHAVAVLDRIARDLQGTYLLAPAPDQDPISHPWIFLSGSLTGGETADAIKFVTRNHRPQTIDGASSDVAVVAYYLNEQEDGYGYQLMRWLTPRIPDQADRIFPPADDPHAMLIAEDLDFLRFRFLGADGETFTEWDSSLQPFESATPIAVELEVSIRQPRSDEAGLESDALEFEDESPERTFSRLVVLPMRPVSIAILQEQAAAANQAGETANDESDEDGEEAGCQRGTLAECAGSLARSDALDTEFDLILGDYGGSTCVEDVAPNEPLVDSRCP